MFATIIVACITALSAIIAPIITAIVNNRYQLKLKRIELYDEKRISVINEYVSCVNKYLNRPSTSAAIDANSVLNSIFLYAPKEMWIDISELNTFIENNQLQKAREAFPMIVQKLSPSIFI